MNMFSEEMARAVMDNCGPDTKDERNDAILKFNTITKDTMHDLADIAKQFDMPFVAALHYFLCPLVTALTSYAREMRTKPEDRKLN